MKTKFFRNTAPVIPTPSTSLGAGSAKRSGGISRLTHDATIKAGAHVSRCLGKLGMTVLFMLCVPMVLSAQNGVTVTNLEVGAGTVTFNVNWNADEVPGGKAWVFVDYNKGGVMTRLLVSGATVSAGTAEWVNDKGAWVINSENVDNFSTTVTLSFTSPSIISGACVYASGYPPEAEYINVETIKFTGTPPYDLVLQLADASTVTRQSGNLFNPVGQMLQSFTDKTGAPGVIKCIPPATFTLLASASGFCEDDATGITFALDGTEKDKQYQLFRNNGDAGDGSVLTGDGSALTFTGTFNVAGTYTARTVADGLTCAIAMNGKHVVTKNPLPANPDVTGDSRNCPGTVTLSASSSGAVIDWYADDVTTSTLHTGESYTTPEIFASTTYYAQARVESTGCLSARVAVVAEVDMAGCCTPPGATVDFTAFDPCSASTGTYWYLTDTREAAYSNTQTYKVKLLQDNHYWMVQDMKFGNLCKNNSYNSTSSNTTGAVTSLSGTWYGNCTAATNTNTPAARGYLYDWAAAINRVNAYYQGSESGCSGIGGGTSSRNPGACQGICPFGWHIPTGAAAGEYMKLHNTIGGCKTTNDQCWNSSSSWEGVIGGSYHWNKYIEYDDYAWYWTSTAYTYAIAYGTTFRGDVMHAGITDNREKRRARAVRCVKNYD